MFGKREARISNLSSGTGYPDRGFPSLSLSAGSRGSSVSIVTGYTVEGRVFDSRQGQEIFLFSTSSRPALGLTQPLIHWIQV
jgi:hypothetical protein